MQLKRPRLAFAKRRLVTVILLTLLCSMGLYNLSVLLSELTNSITLNIFVSATSPPSGVVHEVALTLTNTQTSRSQQERQYR